MTYTPMTSLPSGPPSAHTHPYTDVAGITSAWTASIHTHPAADVVGLPSTWTPAAHTHLVDGITNLPSTYTPSEHTHSFLSTTDRPSSYTPADHAHSWESITGRPSTYTATDHTHSFLSTTGRPSTYTPSTHTHDAADVTTGTMATARLGSGAADNTRFLRGDQSWAVPTAAAADPAYATGSFTLATETGRVQPKRLTLTGAQRATLEGTARLVVCG